MTQTRRRAAEQGAVAASASTPPPKRPCAAEDCDEDDEEETTRHFRIKPGSRSMNCPICVLPFEAEVYMCNNGHAACPRCCLSMSRKCGSCNEPIGDVRCRPLENLLDEMDTDCKYKKYGCVESIKYTQKRAHEAACPRAPSGCPVDGCSYRGLLLYEHVVDDHAGAVATVSYLRSATVTVHKRAPFRVLAEPGRGRVFLLLNGGDVLGGRSLSLVCLGPRPEGNVDVAESIGYKMEVRGGAPGELMLKGTAPCVRRLEGFQPKKFIFVPDADWGSSGTVSVSVRLG
ncbi:hypothetical protein EJB05_06775 [Eragrostis curvula]|uniref:SIAH-type domain-containing protein n=1 Tax=Eragrostis curvula TaxID=38414 RepID=A0A5J9WGV2_9POAL|nr:hypothetical protein EJB05_06775 [Eragrostis curvula]